MVLCYRDSYLFSERALPDVTVGLTGTLADRYVIEREIGRGGMATVYLAHDLRHGSKVAIKMLHPELAPFIGEARFNREIQITARLQHPNILPVFDSGRAGDIPYFVTPYVQGESLAHRIERELQLPVDDSISIASEVADALACAHAQGLVHRDIKPGNILLAHGRAMVADFGIAQLTEPAGSDRLTQRGVALGTAAYMSPEQSSGGTVDGRSDIYSLGCVLYEMLTGQPPFSGINAQAVMARHMIDTVPLLRPVRPTVTIALEKVIHKAMAKAPADRFTDAVQFRDAIRTAGSATSTVITLRPRRYIRIARIVSVVAAAVIVIGGLLLLTSHIPRLGARSNAVVPVDQSRIAVMYFDDNSPNRDMGYLANGLTESLIRELSAVPAIHVISRNGVRPYRDHPVGLDSLAVALHVGSVVEGSVQRSGDKVRVNVDLLDAATGSHLDTRTIEQPVTDLFALEDGVAQQVAELLRRRLGQAIRLRQVQQATKSAPARELLLRADELRDEAATAAAGEATNAKDAVALLQRADSLLAQAETADPQWAQPVIERGWVMWNIAQLSPPELGQAPFELALRYAEGALRRAPNNPSALELHGTVLRQLVADAVGTAQDENQLRQAERDLRAAVAIDPTLASAWSTLSMLLRYRGELIEANIASRRALAEDAYLENAPEVLQQLYRSAMTLGDYPSAQESCERGRRSFPTDWRFVECRLALMLFDTSAAPNPQRAWALVEKLDSMDPRAEALSSRHAYNPIFRRMVAALVLARAGQRDSARAVAALARREVGDDPVARIDFDYDEARLRMALGERDATLRLLTEYLAARPTLKPYVVRDPLFAGLRNDQRFQAIVRPPRE
ncbi:MAG: protein kinase domain-containing protein [Gemmatimonadaceae bacterium]